MEHNSILDATRRWVSETVVGLNLCPFARRELVKERIRFVATDAGSEEVLLMALQDELVHLNEHPEVETTLLVHPGALRDFAEYNEFLAAADGLLEYLELDGIYQIASFHPDYQFGGTGPDDAENYTNRSPYPMLHLLREESLERAIAGYPGTELIPGQNIELMNRLGAEEMRRRLLSF
ncbi:DUF1415 domain-containing protein [Marinobacter vulgaris]|uniref:DUF1415 domain-containing protein n=1 Tax=Marinobacter vulgaris TaxID=1928331 RepID=A0A2V3ZGF0_9GAMM|nr:DUF1415 domain-containing protein [Marinobacter vulgaris]PXX89683.1 DUF1415 domain-containing protein [Marinobacter vulgaris]TSJ68672.1 DUF1415 domain-containing protein [Marinobacter vulgaris]